MDLSGVIFVVLALVWAAYLLPKALRHHDEVARTRSVDEVSKQARVVASAPARSPGRVRRARTPSAERGVAPSPGARAARRRRRILGALLVALVATGVAAAVAALPVWAPAGPGVLVVCFLVLCRVLVRRDRARRIAARRTTVGVAQRRPVTAPPAPARTAPPVPAPSPAATVVVPEGEAAPSVGVPAGQPAAAPVGSLDDTTTFRELVVGVPAQRTGSPAGATTGPAPVDSLWDPLPVTLPTYVGKQRAMRSVRTISLGDPGVSSSGRDAGDSALVAGATVNEAAAPGSGSQRVVGG